MIRVITYGTFDLLHYGHINLLRRAKALGDYLIVALSTDEFNRNQKHKKCYFPYEKRKMILEAIRYVDLIIPEENWEQKTSDIAKYEVDIFVIGDDWTGKFDFLKTTGKGCEVVYLPRTPEISTTHIKNDLKSSDTLESKLTLLLQRQKQLLDLEKELLEQLAAQGLTLPEPRFGGEASE